MLFGRTTLSKFVIEQTRAQHGELGALLIDVAAAVKTISAMVAIKPALHSDISPPPPNSWPPTSRNAPNSATSMGVVAN